MMTALRYWLAAAVASLRALGRRQQRRSDLDRAWRDVVALMPDHATDWRSAR